MDPESGRDEAPAREIRIQGLALFVAGGVLLTLLAAAFWAGRWFERQTASVRRDLPAAAASSGAAEEPRADDVTFFDTLGAAGKASAEPEREARSRKTPVGAGAPNVSPARAESPTVSAGPFVVQVFAGRDRRAAEELVKALQDRGYPVAVEGEAEGRGVLYKVRVGGYATRAEAQSAAGRLKGEGQGGAWVTRRD